MESLKDLLPSTATPSPTGSEPGPAKGGVRQGENGHYAYWLSPEEVAAIARQKEQWAMARMTVQDGCPSGSCLATNPYSGQQIEVHTCCACHDARWVVDLAVPVGQRSRYVPCPSCVGRAPADEEAWATARFDFRARARIPEGFAPYTFEAFDPKPDAAALDVVKRYARTWPPAKPLLLLESQEYGNGKTHLAVSALAAVWEWHGQTGLFVSSVELMERLQATFGQHRMSASEPEADAPETTADVLHDLRRTPLLVVDDLGAEQATEWARSRIYSLVNYRWSNKLPLIVTTNRDLGQFDGRIADRLMDGHLSTVVTLKGHSRRVPPVK